MQVWVVDVAWEIWWSLLNTLSSLPCPYTFFTSSSLHFIYFFKFFKCACTYIHTYTNWRDQTHNPAAHMRTGKNIKKQKQILLL